MTNDFNTASAPFNIAAIGNPADYQMQDMKGAGFVGGLADLGFQIAKPEAAKPAIPAAAISAQTFKK